MKKVISILLVISSFLLINVSSVFACVMMPPFIQLKEGEKRCFIYPPEYYQELNIITLDESNIDTICPNFLLTDADKKIIFEALEQYKSDYRYSYIEKQTDEKFNGFQKKIKKINSAICDCSKIVFHERRGVWTIYTKDFKDSCSFSPACYEPPFYCPDSIYFPTFLFWVSILTGGIITGIIVFIKIKYKA